MFLTTDAVGGVWNYSLTLAEGLAKLGCHCTAAIVGPAPSEGQREQAARAGLELAETGLQLDWTARDAAEISSAAAELCTIAQAYDADSIHLHTPSFAAASWRVPVVAVSHSCMATWWSSVAGTTIDKDFLWRKQAVLEGLQKADCVMAPSHAFARDMVRVYGTIKNLKVVYNGVPLPALANTRRADHGFCAGRMWDRGKNFETLDAASADLAFKMLAAGPLTGADGTSFAPRHLTSLGSLAAPALEQHYRTAALFASSSHYEPFGLAVLEAAGYAMPLVLSDIPTFRELWDGAACFVSEDTPAAWAQALERLMEAPEQRTELGARARARASGYTPEKMASATYAIHRAVHDANLAAA